MTVTCSTADWTATCPGDYAAMLPTTVTFRPGQTMKTVTVRVNGDTIQERTENFSLRLSNARNGLIADDIGIATILNSRVRTGTRSAIIPADRVQSERLVDAALASLGQGSPRPVGASELDRDQVEALRPG